MIKINKVKCVYCERYIFNYREMIVVNGDKKIYAHIKCFDNKIKDKCVQCTLEEKYAQ